MSAISQERAWRKAVSPRHTEPKMLAMCVEYLSKVHRRDPKPKEVWPCLDYHVCSRPLLHDVHPAAKSRKQNGRFLGEYLREDDGWGRRPTCDVLGISGQHEAGHYTKTPTVLTSRFRRLLRHGRIRAMAVTHVESVKRGCWNPGWL